MAIIVLNNQSRFVSAKLYSTSGQVIDVAEVTKKISKVMMSSPQPILESALDQTGLRVSPEVAEDILNRFRNAGLLAYRFFQWSEKQRHYEHSVRAYHMMIESTAKIKQYKLMWDLINSMRKKKMLNVETFCIVMRKYARAQKVDEAVYAFNVMEKYDLAQNLAAFNGLLSALCKSKNVRKAQEIFETMRERVLKEMKSKGVTPNSKTCNIILRHLIECGEKDEAFDVFRKMIRVCEPDADTYTMMIKMFCEKKEMETANKVWRRMRKKGVFPSMHTFAVLINGLCEEGDTQRACVLLEEMIEMGIRPSGVTFGRLRQLLLKESRDDVVKFLNEKMNLLVNEPLCD
ncbi:hypothetical protein HID58_047622 [Brassica napus]|uniref:Pentatricopeptide repeat-containing protein n=2 Tax=Brassica napus TaxID=3708 RepID=A0ABQ8AZU5_BRANA|nr:hypothetical protein HID58_047622 [Brassica napus]CDY40885.1 BnaCnng09760D [Brassica napus]